MSDPLHSAEKREDGEPPALSFKELVVKMSVVSDAPATPNAPRDLPDLARFLFFALGAQGEADTRVLDNISFELGRGQALALVGEDGSGKSTVARACARILKPDRGCIEVDGVDAHGARGTGVLHVRRNLQVITDDPEGCVDPRLTVEETLALADDALLLAPHGPTIQRFAIVLARVHLDHATLLRRAADLTPGEKKRVALARALLPNPSVIVVDEPAGGLDPSERAVVLDTFDSVRRAPQPTAPALLVLTKDLAAARTLADRVGVLLNGLLVELSPTRELFDAPVHPYSKSLVAAAPRVRH